MELRCGLDGVRKPCDRSAVVRGVEGVATRQLAVLFVVARQSKYHPTTWFVRRFSRGALFAPLLYVAERTHLCNGLSQGQQCLQGGPQPGFLRTVHECLVPQLHGDVDGAMRLTAPCETGALCPFFDLHPCNAGHVSGIAPRPYLAAGQGSGRRDQG